MATGESACLTGQVFGCADIAGQIDELTRQIGALTRCTADLDRCFGFAKATGVPPAASVTRFSVLAGFLRLLSV